MVSPCHEGVTKGVKKGVKWGKMGQKWAKRGRKSGNKYTAIDVGVVGISGGPLGVHRRSIGGLWGGSGGPYGVTESVLG